MVECEVGEEAWADWPVGLRRHLARMSCCVGIIDSEFHAGSAGEVCSYRALSRMTQKA